MPLNDDRFFKACPLAELAGIPRKVCEIEGQPVLLLKHGKHLHAIRNRCTHQDYPLDKGRQIGFEIICRKHGARFDIRTGAVVGGPAVRRLEIYETRISGEDVQVRIPVREKNDIWPD